MPNVIKLDKSKLCYYQFKQLINKTYYAISNDSEDGEVIFSGKLEECKKYIMEEIWGQQE